MFVSQALQVFVVSLAFGLFFAVFGALLFRLWVRYVADFEKVSRTAVVLTKRLLYQMDGLSFDAALQTGADVNTIARMTDDCRAGIERFLTKVK